MTWDEGRVGTSVDGRFELTALLGRGAHGVVYRAVQRAVDREVALKILPCAAARDPEVRARFEQEAKAIARLRSMHTVAVYDYGRLRDGAFFIAMELVDGEDLATVLAREGPLEVGRCRTILSQVAASLAQAHAAGIVHRDVKPANIILQASDDAARVLDFGVSKLNDARVGWTGAGDLVGTPLYMAPEQWSEDRGKIGPTTDVYALGVTLFECLTGEGPFSGTTTAQLMHAHLERAPRMLPRRVSDDAQLRNILEVALAKRPDDRYPSAEAFAHALTATSPPTDQITNPASPARGVRLRRSFTRGSRVREPRLSRRPSSRH